MQPPLCGSAEGTRAQGRGSRLVRHGFSWRKLFGDVQADGRAGFGGVRKGGVVGGAQIVPEPDQGRAD